MRAIIIASFLLAAPVANAEPVRDEGPNGGYAAYVDQRQKDGHDRWGFAGAYRAGDYVYLSGVVVGARPDETLDADGLTERVRQTLQRADESFKAADASLAEVVEIISFHVFDSPRTSVDKIGQVDAIAAAKREFITSGDPAWTAIGVSELLPDNGIIEIRMVA